MKKKGQKVNNIKTNNIIPKLITLNLKRILNFSTTISLKNTLNLRQNNLINILLTPNSNK